VTTENTSILELTDLGTSRLFAYLICALQIFLLTYYSNWSLRFLQVYLSYASATSSQHRFSSFSSDFFCFCASSWAFSMLWSISAYQQAIFTHTSSLTNIIAKHYIMLWKLSLMWISYQLTTAIHNVVFVNELFLTIKFSEISRQNLIYKTQIFQVRNCHNYCKTFTAFTVHYNWLSVSKPISFIIVVYGIIYYITPGHSSPAFNKPLNWYSRSGDGQPT